MTRRFATASIFLAGLMLADVQHAAAQQATGQEGHEFNAPLIFTVINPCTEEPVLLDGNVDFLVQLTTGPSGNFTAKNHVAATGRGFGQATGVNYTFGSETDVEAQFISRPDNFTNTQKLAVHLANAGRDDNFILLLLTHTTVNGNGVGAAVDNVTCKCAGAGGAESGPEVMCLDPLPDPLPDPQ
jgi:hypothetical protein